MTEFYDRGDTAEITAEFQKSDLTYIDPEGLKLIITDPDGIVIERVYLATTHIVRDALGKFHCNHLVDKNGTWLYQWVTSGSTGASVQNGDIFVKLTQALVVRTAGNKDLATTFGTQSEIETIIFERTDFAVWFEQTVELRTKMLITAYRDLNKLAWSTTRGYAQNRDYWQGAIFQIPNEPPVDDPDFKIDALHAQAAQAVYICTGTQVRDMAREGVILTRALMGAEMEIAGYKGPVCADAMEHIGRWVELMPRTKRMR